MHKRGDTIISRNAIADLFFGFQQIIRELLLQLPLHSKNVDSV